MDKREFVWNRDWIHSYISNWCIFERFKFSNALNNNDILGIFGNNNVKTVKRIASVGDYLRNLVSLSGIDKEKSIEILGVNLKSRNSLIYKKIKPILGLTYAYAIREHITFCPSCIKFGFHSIFHQMSLFKTCVFHPNEPLVDSCEKCGKILGKYLLSNLSNPPFTCECGFCLLDNNNNVISIFNSWKNKYTIKDEELLTLLSLYKNHKEIPLLIHPIRILRMYNEFDQSNLSLLIDYKKNYYLNVEFKENTILKEVYTQNFLSSKGALKKTISNYNSTFNYRYSIRSFMKKDIIDAVYYEIYMQSRVIYKAIKRYLMKNYLNNHTTCIQINNELNNSGSYCGFALAFTFWREDFEEINLSQKIKQAPVESKIFNFECYLERFTLYPKGIYSNYLENLLDNCFKITSDFNLIDINQIKKVLNTMLPYLLLERFYEYLDLILNPTKYNTNSYNLPNIIPMHLIVIDQHIHKTTIYHQDIFKKLKKSVQDMRKEKNICGFDKNKKYEPYRTPTELAFLKMNLNRG